MAEFYTFAGEHPIVAVLIVWAVCAALTSPLKCALLAYNRTLRSRHILAHGWPTAPVDADGDVVYPKKDSK